MRLTWRSADPRRRNARLANHSMAAGLENNLVKEKWRAT
jgi:hypothetical protein